MIQDRLQYFSVDSQQISQPSHDKWSQSRSTSSNHNRSTSGSKKKQHSDVQVITPTKKESNEIKQNITTILNQVLQRTNNIPLETQLYLKERFNVTAPNHNNSTQSANQSISPQKNIYTFQGNDKSDRKQRSQNMFQKRKENEIQQIQYLDLLIKQEMDSLKEQENNNLNRSPSFPHQPNAKLQVEQLLKNRENFNHSSAFESEQFHKNSSPKIIHRSSQSTSILNKSQSLKKSIQSERLSATQSDLKVFSEIGIQTESSKALQKKDLTNLDSQSIQIQGSESKGKKSTQRLNKHQNSSMTDKKHQQRSSQQSTQNNCSVQESNQRHSISCKKSENSINCTNSTSVKKNMNSTINYQEDVTVYQRVLRQRYQSLTADKNVSEQKSHNKLSVSTHHFSSVNNNTNNNSNSNAKGGRQNNYDSVKKELFKDFQSFSDQFTSENGIKSKSRYNNIQSSSNKKQGLQFTKEYKNIVHDYELQQQKNQEKKQQIVKSQLKQEKDISYLQKLRGMISILKKENKKLIEPLNNQATKNEEKNKIEKSLKKQEYDIKQLEKENLSYQTQLKRALEELTYWQNKDKPKEIKMSLNNSAQSSVYNPEQPQINIKISQSDIYSALTSNVYNGQTYYQ